MTLMDILMLLISFTVSKEMAGKFYNLSPSITHSYQIKFPEIYEDHLKRELISYMERFK